MLLYDAEEGEILGNADELKAFARSVHGQSNICARTNTGAEVELLEFRLTSGKLVLACGSDRLVLTGPAEKLEIFGRQRLALS